MLSIAEINELKAKNKGLAENLVYAQIEKRQLKEKITELKQKLVKSDEQCMFCDTWVQLPPYLGIYRCPKCGKLIINCAKCIKRRCAECELNRILTHQKFEDKKKEQMHKNE